MTTFTDEVAAAAVELSHGGRWERALALLDAVPGPAPRIALAAAEVALEQDWWAGTETAGERIAAAEKAGADGWELDFLRLRNDYLRLIHPAGEHFQPGPAGKDPEAIAEVERRGARLRATAPGPVEAGWADFYRGVIADNLRADRQAAPARYEAALAAGEGRDDLLAREALRHLGDHDHDNGDHAAALDRWRRATALGARAGRVTGTLSQQLLLAVLARDAGDEPAAVALATEVERWAAALGATRIRDNAAGFLAGVDPTAEPEPVTG
ncbi:hypothetical protein [Actinoplanes subtropicus]|uniref:hypothetical protein n=1 Tax=Actinoplanes subtropicus TaxID=543632 RepID=UPI0004C2F187|nr:hypothetical protein [Actinoplanes subtropicus]